MIREKTKIKEEDMKKVIIIYAILTTIMIIINIMAFPYLPDYVALQSNGGNIVPKIVFVFIMPCLSTIVTFFNLKVNNRSSLNAILTCIIILAVNVVIIFAQF